MGLITIGALDIGALLIGGIIGRHVQPNVTAACPCTEEEKAKIKAKIAEVRGLLDTLETTL